MRLNPCPFCGDEARQEADREPYGIKAYHAAVICLNEEGCGANIHAVEATTAEAKIASAARWNRRPSQPRNGRGRG